MIQAGITTFIVPADVTTFMKVTYPTEDADVRELMQVRDAGYFTFPEIPTLETRYMHLAGITDREFTLEFIEQLKMAGYDLTLDVQSFVRHVDPESGRITLRDVSAKEHMFRYFSKIKLDNLEARTLTGSSDPEGAAVILESWGSRETLVTQGTGVLVRADHTTFHERLTNRGYSGRTGRGDTTFAGYLAWRIDHGVAESLKFASAIASIKLEKPGPFSGSLDDVLQRMKSDA
jgi:sugar/nucleoside kinase (ribokinase family)